MIIEIIKIKKLLWKNHKNHLEKSGVRNVRRHKNWFFAPIKTSVWAPLPWSHRVFKILITLYRSIKVVYPKGYPIFRKIFHPISSKVFFPFVCADHDRFGHWILVFERQRQSESDAVVVQLKTRVSHRVNGWTADAAGRGEEHRQSGEDVHRQPANGRATRRRGRRGRREGCRRTR